MYDRKVPDPSEPIFRALADPTRRAILETLLAGEELAQKELQPHFDVSQPALSQHLRSLREAGLIDERRAGRHRYYRLAPDAMTPLADWMAPFADFWGGRLEALGDYLRRTP